MIPRGHPLEGVGLKLDRAGWHLAELDRAISEFLKREPYYISYLEAGRGGRRPGDHQPDALGLSRLRRPSSVREAIPRDSLPSGLRSAASRPSAASRSTHRTTRSCGRSLSSLRRRRLNRSATRNAASTASSCSGAGDRRAPPAGNRATTSPEDRRAPRDSVRFVSGVRPLKCASPFLGPGGPGS